MKLKFFFYVLAVLLFIVWIVLFNMDIEEKGWEFYLAVGLITFSLFYLSYFYQKVVKPLNAIANGMDLLREQDFSSRLAPVGQSEADRIVQVFNRMMLQLKDERLRLREQNHFLDLLISISPMGVMILTFDEEVSMINKAALQFLDGEEEKMMGKRLDELTGPLMDEIKLLPQDTSKTVRLSDSHVYRCSRLSFVDRGFSHPFILIESLTDEVMKAEKKAYEKVIRMIAHEVNNTVAGVTSALETVDDVLRNMDETDDLHEVMQVCLERCFSMSRFITNFADVVKIPEPQLQEVNLNERVESCLRFMEHLCLDNHIALHMDLCYETPEVEMDTVLFEQVIVNIIKNAVESIGRDGDIYIRTMDNPPTLEIGDNGKGITKEAEAKLFTPFFSTKPNGQGIGLVFIREVLTMHRCSFSLRTEEDGITRFRIRFNA